MQNDDEKGVLEYVVQLTGEQHERLERELERRSALDRSADPQSILVEALEEHLHALNRSAILGRDGRPNRPDALYDHLFGEPAETAFECISAGIIAIMENAEELLEDAAILVGLKRYARADFLIATAQEELGKAFVLLDMCRVNLSQKGVLQRLCRTFYSHVLKNVYFDLSANKYEGISTLSELQHFYRQDAKEWWPSSPESGEPDMPNDVYFLREANLYVDIDTYSGTWMAPNSRARSIFYEDAIFPTPLDSAREALGRFREAQHAGLFNANALQIFNEQMKQLNVSKTLSLKKLREAYGRAGQALETSLAIPIETFEKSMLYNWPMSWIK